MEINQVEVEKIAKAASAAQESSLVELVDLQLALIGGGVGEVMLT